LVAENVIPNLKIKRENTDSFPYLNIPKVVERKAKAIPNSSNSLTWPASRHINGPLWRIWTGFKTIK
jgi:hypothetical protein